MMKPTINDFIEQIIEAGIDYVYLDVKSRFKDDDEAMQDYLYAESKVRSILEAMVEE